MPLQTGTTAMWSLARSAAFLVPSLVSTTALVVMVLQFVGVPILDHPVVRHYAKDMIAWFFFLGFLGIAFGPPLLGFSIAHLYRFFRNLPSDVLVSPTDLKVQTVLRTYTYPWSEVIGPACYVTVEREKRITIGYIILRALSRSTEHVERSDIEVARLILPTNRGDHVILGTAERPIERESLQAVCETIQASDTDEQIPSPRLSQQYQARIIHCPQCQAVIQPRNADTVDCTHCGQSVAMPDELRLKLRDVRQIARSQSSLETLIRSLIRQPSAVRTNVYVFLCAALMFLAWPVALALLTLVDHYDFISPQTMSACFISPLAFILGLFFILRGHTARRGALRLLTLHYGARPPAFEGEPHTCRSCGAPLHEEPDQILIRCTYCEADNILALDLKRRAAPAAEQERRLAEDLRAQRRERTKWSVFSALAILIVVASILLAVATVMNELAG
ncbi:MAG: hypothetical protein JRG91_02395 [Deltaproteobacteria bacterium]|nr:hypothetical protein [Deltaproteobacteria bacterium]